MNPLKLEFGFAGHRQTPNENRRLRPATSLQNNEIELSRFWCIVA
jgi:hypothetical protein